MIERLISDMLGLLIPTLFIAFLWRRFRIEEISVLDSEPEKRWRLVLAGLLIPVYALYVVTFDRTPLAMRIAIALVELIAFSVWIYYCDQKMGKLKK